jgi:glucose-6-phosphate 1-dehydrogenase
MQNHLLQVLSLIAMEPPSSLSADDVRQAKVKVLQSIAPISIDETIIGQYVATNDTSNDGYLDDPTVPPSSIAATYAVCILHINTRRWKGVPFIMRAGKALNRRSVEVRVTFKHPFPHLMPHGDDGGNNKLPSNELIIQVSPSPTVSLTMTTMSMPAPLTSVPLVQSTMKLMVNDSDSNSGIKYANVPVEAYERLILAVIKGDQRMFVRQDEVINTH